MFELELDDRWAADLSRQILSASWQEQEEEDRQARARGDFIVRPAPQMVDRIKGLTIRIWADEHPPPHFHVDYQGIGASFSILTCDRLPGTAGLEREEKAIRTWWTRNRPRLIQVWNESRPTSCPVGPVILP